MSTQDKIDKPVRFTLVYERGKLISCSSTSPVINHFLDVIKLNRTYNTWVNYAHDLKTFFSIVPKAPETINRQDCIMFMKQQQLANLSDATINRRLAAISSLFKEMDMLGVVKPNENPVQPAKAGPRQHRRSQSLYKQHQQRIPDIVAEDNMKALFSVLPTWRDRTLLLLMWISCLRVGEVVAIQFDDIECSRRSILIRTPKGGHPRLVYMDRLTFGILNKYLDEERKDLFPEVGAVFVAFKGKARGQPLSVNTVQKLVTYYAKKCNLPHVHPHLFRHTGITHLIRQKMPEPVLRQFVGHRHPDSLMPYLHLGDDYVEAEFANVQDKESPTNWLHIALPGGAK